MCANAFDLALNDGQAAVGTSRQPQTPKCPRCGAELNARRLDNVIKGIGRIQGKCMTKIFGSKAKLGCGTRIGNSPVKLIGDGPLIHTLEIRQVEGLLALVAQDIGVVLKHRDIFCQRSRLVHAHYVYGAQRLHGIDVLNDDLLVFETTGAARQTDARNDWKHFGNQTNGRSQSKQQRLRPVAQHDATNRNDKRQHNQHALD